MTAQEADIPYKALNGHDRPQHGDGTDGQTDDQDNLGGKGDGMDVVWMWHVAIKTNS